MVEPNVEAGRRGGGQDPRGDSQDARGDGPLEGEALARRRIRVAKIGLAGFAAAAGASTYLYLANPHEPGLPVFTCPFRAATGLDCPGCGGQRMVYDLLHGDVAGALHNNAFFLVLLPVAVVAAGYGLVKAWRGRVVGFPARSIVVVSVVAVVWWVARNLPGFPLVPT